MNALSPHVIKYIDQSVLCWLATTDQNLQPNVSPKEIFTCFGKDHIIIANIASPKKKKNIRLNDKVCLSFIDILVQKGYQLYGSARIVDQTASDFAAMENLLTRKTEGKFPFVTIFDIAVNRVKPIIAPRYNFYPLTTEEEQIASARRLYGL